MEVQFRKAYVTVNADIDQEGDFHPRLIHWKDGMVFEISEIKDKRRAKSEKVEGGGIRYTIIIGGRQSLLFHEGARWFVEAKA